MISEQEVLTEYRKTVRDLYRYVSHRTGRQRELTEDVVQETYMRALSHWRRKGRPGVPLAWLKTVARNLLISHYRRIKPESLEELGIDPESDRSNSDGDGRMALLYYGLTRLRKDQSGLLEAFYFDGKSVREIAEELGSSERAVEGRLRRARKRLEKHLRRLSLDVGDLT